MNKTNGHLNFFVVRFIKQHEAMVYVIVRYQRPIHSLHPSAGIIREFMYDSNVFLGCFIINILNFNLIFNNFNILI